MGYRDCRARYRLLAQRRHDLQDRRAGQGARGNMAGAVIVAHQSRPCRLTILSRLACIRAETL